MGTTAIVLLSEWLRCETCGGRAVSFLFSYASAASARAVSGLWSPRVPRRRQKEALAECSHCRPLHGAAIAELPRKLSPRRRGATGALRRQIAISTLLCTVNKVSVLVKPRRPPRVLRRVKLSFFVGRMSRAAAWVVLGSVAGLRRALGPHSHNSTAKRADQRDAGTRKRSGRRQRSL